MIIKQTLGKLNVNDFRPHHEKFSTDEGNRAVWKPRLFYNFAAHQGPPPAYPSVPLTAWWGEWVPSPRGVEEGRGGWGRAWESPPSPPSFYH